MKGDLISFPEEKLWNSNLNAYYLLSFVSLRIPYIVCAEVPSLFLDYII